MKRKSQENIFIKILNHLDSNSHDRSKRQINFLKEKVYVDKDNEIYLDLIEYGYIKEKEGCYKITIRGEDYLRNYQTRNFEVEQYKINRILMIATVILAVSSVQPAFSSDFKLFFIIIYIGMIGLLIYFYLKQIRL